jgi:hypothetical protein
MGVAFDTDVDRLEEILLSIAAIKNLVACEIK